MEQLLVLFFTFVLTLIKRISDSSDYFLLALMPSSLVEEQLNRMKLKVVTSQYTVILVFVRERPEIHLVVNCYSQLCYFSNLGTPVECCKSFILLFIVLHFGVEKTT